MRAKLGIALAVLAILVIAAAAAGTARTRGADMVRVGGKRNACCCTQRIEPEDP